VYILQWTLILPPPPSFQIWFFSPYLYYISLKGLYLIVLPLVQRRPAFLFGVLWPMGANGGIDKTKSKWRKIEGNEILKEISCFKFRSKSGKN
jgi:hypothetical protein